MEKAKILVVEDESIVARDIRNMLLALGYEVTAVVSDAKEAIKNAKKEQPHLVLMDIMLQGDMSGVEAAGKIYSKFNIPVVYLTAFADETTLQRAKETEPFGYLLKPFEERELKSTIEIAIYKFGMEMKLRERERWLTTMLKSIEDGVIATDKKGTVTFMNPLAESLTGWQQAKALNKPLNKVYKIFDNKEDKGQSIAIKDILTGDEYRLPSDIVLVSKLGKAIPVDHRAAPITDETGNTLGVVLAFRDITRQKKTEEELIQSYERLKQAMDGTVQAMATHRPYRPALSIEDALDEILENKGKLYYPKVVEACLEIFEEGFKFEEK